MSVLHLVRVFSHHVVSASCKTHGSCPHPFCAVFVLKSLQLEQTSQFYLLHRGSDFPLRIHVSDFMCSFNPLLTGYTHVITLVKRDWF